MSVQVLDGGYAGLLVMCFVPVARRLRRVQPDAYGVQQLFAWCAERYLGLSETPKKAKPLALT